MAQCSHILCSLGPHADAFGCHAPGAAHAHHVLKPTHMTQPASLPTHSPERSQVRRMLLGGWRHRSHGELQDREGRPWDDWGRAPAPAPHSAPKTAAGCGCGVLTGCGAWQSAARLIACACVPACLCLCLPALHAHACSCARPGALRGHEPHTHCCCRATPCRSLQRRSAPASRALNDHMQRSMRRARPIAAFQVTDACGRLAAPAQPSASAGRLLQHVLARRPRGCLSLL